MTTWDETVEQQAKEKIRTIFDPKGYGYAWFNHGDGVGNMRTALIIRITAQIALYSRDRIIGRDLQQWRDFLGCVLQHKPYITSDPDVIGSACAAAQMIETQWEARENLLNLFITRRERP